MNDKPRLVEIEETIQDIAGGGLEDCSEDEMNVLNAVQHAMDVGYNKSKEDILKILDKYIEGPWDVKSKNLLYDIIKEIEEL